MQLQATHDGIAARTARLQWCAACVQTTDEPANWAVDAGEPTKISFIRCGNRPCHIENDTAFVGGQML